MEKAVTKNMVVTVAYELFDESGTLLEETGDHPFVYIHGIGQLLPALEGALEGMKVNESKDVTLTPDEGFGQYDEDRVLRIPRTAFGPDAELEAGMRMYMRDQSGEALPFTILEVGTEDVLADFNHPLAGKTLTFRLKVLGIREATEEELAHGHVHDEMHEA